MSIHMYISLIYIYTHTYICINIIITSYIITASYCNLHGLASCILTLVAGKHHHVGHWYWHRTHALVFEAAAGGKRCGVEGRVQLPPNKALTNPAEPNTLHVLLLHF